MKVSTRSGAEGPGPEVLPKLPADDLSTLRAALRAWYASGARPLRIRSTREPWAILVSEVMAQQTQVERVDAAWAEFMARFPTPGSLARSPTAEVLRAWAGLGYNRRALNLRRAAAIIEADYAGQVPADVAALEALPGVGPYTARAVAAIAFGRPVAAVDTNVRRVLTRLADRRLSTRETQALADRLVDRADPATWTHASMELGATVCLPRAPRCGECPVQRWCAGAGGSEAPTPRPRASQVPFERTTRWLRGRIIEHLRAVADDAWHRLPPAMGVHDAEAIEAAVRALQQEGLLERAPDGSVRLPSGR